jgi:hypothetical protein
MDVRWVDAPQNNGGVLDWTNAGSPWW